MCRNTRRMRRSALIGVVVSLWSCLGGVPAPVSAEDHTPTRLSDWFEQEHQFLQRYLKVLRQAAHDYSYGYCTPMLMMPIVVDLFSGYVAPIHDAEEQIIYPTLKAHLEEAQAHELWLVQADEGVERETVKSLTDDIAQYEAGQKKLTEVGDRIDYLARMINRHIVLEEQRVLPQLNLLSANEQQAILQHLATFERERLGPSGRVRYDQLLDYLQAAIDALGGRVW